MLDKPKTLHATRVDHLLIAEMVAPGSRVLDVGCGDGELLQLLADTKAVDARGVELSRERVNACVARGLSVIQGDADEDLADYPDQAFDYAISVVDHPGNVAATRGAGKTCCESAGGQSFHSQTSATGESGPTCCYGAACQARPIFLNRGTRVRIRICARSATLWSCVNTWTRSSKKRWRSTAPVGGFP